MKSDHAKPASRTLAVSLLLAALLALTGCGGGGEQGSQSEQGSQEETTTTAASAPETTGGGGTTTAAVGGGGATAEVVAATEAFLATLDDAQREQLSFEFDDELKSSNWSNLPTGIFERSGVALGDMTEEQQQAAMAMLQAALSEEGYQKTVGIMASDQALANEGGGPGDLVFGIDEYYVTIFGTPSETEPWMLQFGGHHLAINLTVSGQDNILTPSFTGIQPSEYTLDEVSNLPAFIPTDVLEGPTVRPMADENDLAFELINALGPDQQEQAILDYEVTDLVLGADEDVRVLEPEGLPASEMTPEQQALLLDVVREWAGIVDEGATEARMSEIEANLNETYFAWSGPTTNGEPIYYRVMGPTLHIEFSHQNQGPPPGGILHIHSVYRDPTNDYGEQSVAS